MTAAVILAVAASAVVTSILSGVFGMAGGLVLMGILLALMPVPAAMVLHGATQIASNGWRAFLWRRYVDRRIMLRFGAGSLVALGVFSLIRFVPDRAVVLIVLGLTPLVAVAIPDRIAPRVDRVMGAEICGFLGTCVQLVSGVSGPLLDVFYVRCAFDRRAVVATKAACQVLSQALKLLYFGFVLSGAGDLPWWVVAMSVALAMVGTTLSRAILERLTDVQFRSWTQRIVVAIGVVYLVQGLVATGADEGASGGGAAEQGSAAPR